MPNLGDITLGKNINKNSKHRFVWSACCDCKRELWVDFYWLRNLKVEQRPFICRQCSSIRKRKKLYKGTIEKPCIGDIRIGKELKFNMAESSKKAKYIYVACEICNLQRWVRIFLGKPQNTICKICSAHKRANSHKYRGSKSSHWKGGRYINDKGYVMVYVSPDDFFYSMCHTNVNMVLEHRIVMAKHLGRILQKWEVVHHKNGIKTDNRIENLELGTKNSHIKDHNKGYQDGYKRGYYDGHNKKVNELIQQIKSLELKISNMEALSIDVI